MAQHNRTLVAIIGYGSTILWMLLTAAGIVAGIALVGLSLWDWIVWVLEKDWWSTNFDGSILALAALAVIAILNRAVLLPLRVWAEKQVAGNPATPDTD